MVERHEGAESAAIAAHWLERQPAAFCVRSAGADAEPAGLPRADRAARGRRGRLRARSRGAGGVGARAAPRAAARRGTRCCSAASCMDRDAYQAPSRSFNVVTIRSTQEWLGRPRLSWYYIAFADPEAMAPLMAYIYFAPRAGGRLRGRRAPLRGVRARLAARRRRRDGSSGWPSASSATRRRRRRPSGDRGRCWRSRSREFADAVRRALRDLHRPDALAAIPLARHARGARAPRPSGRRRGAARADRRGGRRAARRPARREAGARPGAHLPASRRRPRRPPPSCSVCPSAPTAAT